MFSAIFMLTYTPKRIKPLFPKRRLIEMRILIPIFTLLLLLSVVGCGAGEDDTSAGEDDTGETGSSPIVSWHALEQSERNQKILQEALDDYGDLVGRSCKKWVYDVVYSASNGDVTIPLNNESGDAWQINPFAGGDVILSHQNRSPALLNTIPGAIVQMQWKAGLFSDDSKYNIHTAIVLAVLPDGVIFIESNYDNTPKDESDAVVSIRFVSEEEFIEKVQSFSVYYIL